MKRRNTILMALALVVLCGGVLIEPATAYGGNAAALNTRSQAVAVAAQDAPAQAQTFTGQISQSNGKYVLNAGEVTYSLDDQTQAKQYDGKQVKVTGTLDAQTNTIRVQKIEAVTS